MADVLYLERLQRHLAAAVAAADLEEEVEISEVKRMLNSFIMRFG